MCFLGMREVVVRDDAVSVPANYTSGPRGCGAGHVVRRLGGVATKEIPEIVERVDSVQLATRDQAVHDRGSTTTVIIANKQPVLTSRLGVEHVQPRCCRCRSRDNHDAAARRGRPSWRR